MGLVEKFKKMPACQNRLIRSFLLIEHRLVTDRDRQTDRHRAARRAGKNVGFQRRAGRRGCELRAPLTEGVRVWGGLWPHSGGGHC